MGIVGSIVRGAGKTVKWAMILGVLLVVVVIVVAVVGVGQQASEDQGNAKDLRAKVAQVKLGSTPTQVRASLGKPDDTQQLQSNGLTERCWYYGGLSDDQWQLCFTNGKLDSKNRY